MRKVHIVGRDYSIANMFLKQGWEVVDYIDKNIDLIQFTGGEDVDPSYYGQTKHPRTYSNPKRDAYEANIFNEWKGEVPMAGICRGGQFLNVMNGGSMWQHVDNHALSKTHDAHCLITDTIYQVTSTHHQMMIPAVHAKLLLTASLSTRREDADSVVEGVGTDTEAVYYGDTQCLCFQPHPEYVSINHECQILYFEYINRFLL